MVRDLWRRHRKRLVLGLLLGFMAASGGCRREEGATKTKPSIAVTNTYLAAAVRDLWGDKGEVFCLAEPGMCPGHFDMTAGQVNRLRKSRLLLRFDFQKGLDKQLARLVEAGLVVYPIEIGSVTCVPEAYLSVCRQTAEALSEAGYGDKSVFEQRFGEIQHRLKGLSEKVRQMVAVEAMPGTTAVVSDHQEALARMLGLEVVGIFRGREKATPGRINECLEAARSRSIRFVIANRQEGTQLAKALSERLEARLLVFSNFPESPDGPDGFDRLLLQNVGELLGKTIP